MMRRAAEAALIRAPRSGGPVPEGAQFEPVRARVLAEERAALARGAARHVVERRGARLERPGAVEGAREPDEELAVRVPAGRGAAARAPGCVLC